MKPDSVNTEVNENKLLPQENNYTNLQFVKSKLKSPIGSGQFTIFINKDKNILYKKTNTKIRSVEKYKKIIYSLKNNPVLSEYIFQPEKIYIEDDGSYYSSYIKNGIRLYDINSNFNMDENILNNLKNTTQDMKKKLNNYVKKIM